MFVPGVRQADELLEPRLDPEEDSDEPDTKMSQISTVRIMYHWTICIARFANEKLLVVTLTLSGGRP